ncbi:MAG TPA: aminotransferase class V-fold PLP-dependent enzyme [Methylococcus sp.]|nr:aminotransferase class V-fold PLP-dependent enzyme [Methylococcus sp.]
MPITRRELITNAGLALAVSALASPQNALAGRPRSTARKFDDWQWVRDQFNLSREYIHLAPFYIASHPRPVREAIEKYRRAIDANPVLTVDPAVFGTDSVVGLTSSTDQYLTQTVREVIAEYVGGKAEEIALTGSTTMGLALVYNGLSLKPGEEMLTTVHDFYPQHEAIRLAAERTGASVRKIALFDSFDTISEDGIAERVRNAIRPNTRTFGITWVHSASGVKLPIRRIAEVIQEANRSRDENNRVLLIVDGVHGFGVEDETVAEMGCDIFVAGTHKWMFAPRGTGIIWARESTWAKLKPTIPSFIAIELWEAWKEDHPPTGPTLASWVTPGGFHAFEHQWAMAEAFRFHRQIGRKRIAERTHELNGQCKEGLAKMRHVKLYTPRGSRFSSGLICFDVEGMRPEEVARRLLERKIVMTKTPYGRSYARIAPSILTTPAEIDKTLREIRALVSG